MRKTFSQAQRLTILTGILCMVLILVILQLWLLTGTMSAFLGGDEGIVWPAALGSLVCFLLNLGLLRYVYAVDSESTGENVTAAPRQEP